MKETLDCIVVRRKYINDKNGESYYKYLICNGTFMGKYTILFGATCLADSFDCKGFARTMAENTKDCEILNYVVTPTP